MSDTDRSSTTDYGKEANEVLGYSRWWLIVAAALMMALASPYQYVWSSLEGPFADRFDASLVALGFIFTTYVILMSLTQFPAGWWRDRYGPRKLSVLAGVLTGGGFFGLAFATEFWQLVLLYSLGSVGVGIVYTVSVNTAVKWFPDKRGLTTGIGTMAFGAGSAAFIPFVRSYAAADELSRILLYMGVLISVGIVVGAFFLRDPPTGWLEQPTLIVDEGQGDGEVDANSVGSEPDETANPGPDHESPTGDEPGTDSIETRSDGESPEDESVDPAQTDERTPSSPDSASQYTWRETIATWQFWVMYGMFFFVSAAGLMLTARIVLYAENVELLALTATVAATVLPIASGGGRLLVGAASDRLPRESVMGVSFFLCGIGTLAVVAFGQVGSDVGFIVAVAVAVFFWSSQFSVFPSTVGDYYGPMYSSSNYALLYSAKMWGGVFGGVVVGYLVTIFGWSITFVIGGVLALLAGIAGFVLRPPEGETF